MERRKDKKEKKKKEKQKTKMKAVTSNLCWVASLLLQLHTTPTLSYSSSQFVFFPSQIIWF